MTPEEQRNLAYVSIVIDLTDVDRDAIVAMPPDQQFLTLAKASAERGVTTDDIVGWAALCDSHADPPGCFRELAEPAYKEPISLGKAMVIAGVFWAAVAFGATELVRRRGKLVG